MKTRHSIFSRSTLCAALVGIGMSFGAVAQPAAGASGTAGSSPAAATPMTTPAAKPAAAHSDASRAGKDSLARGDRKFIETAAMGGMIEVELGKLAQDKASNDQVKQFGARMVKDHGKANEELMQIASAKGVQPPATLDKKHQKDVDRLQKLSGADFDRAYMSHMVDDHKKDVSDFKKQAKSGKDAQVQAFAAKTLPTLEEHLQLAKTTEDAVKSAGKNAHRGAGSAATGAKAGASHGAAMTPGGSAAPMAGSASGASK